MDFVPSLRPLRPILDPRWPRLGDTVSTAAASSSFGSEKRLLLGSTILGLLVKLRVQCIFINTVKIINQILEENLIL